jgi:hypothetical protein
MPRPSSPPPTLEVPRWLAAFGDRVITPGDAGYDRARTVFYGGFDQRPAAIVRPADTREVAQVVNLARDRGLELAIRSGGHSLAGHSASDGGIVLDLSAMTALEVDRQSGTAWAQTGLTAGAYTKAVGADGLATGFGDTGSVGIGGLTLGGGIGFLVRKHGLTIDNLLAAELVTADGQVLQVDHDQHPELFWAIRGGGGNFGVATRFRFRLHELPGIVGGMLLLPADDPGVIEGFMAAAAAAPEELSAIANIMVAPPIPFIPAEHHGKMVIMGMLAYAGDSEAGTRALAPFRALAEPLADMVRPMPYAGLFEPEEGDVHPTVVARTMFMDTVDHQVAGTIAGRGHGPGAGRGDRLRPPPAADHGRGRRRLPAGRGPAGPGRLGRRLHRRPAPGRPRGVCQLPQRRGAGAGPRGLPGAHLGPAGRGQAPLRPGQPVPAEPEHPAERLIACGM